MGSDLYRHIQMMGLEKKYGGSMLEGFEQVSAADVANAEV